MPDPSHSDPSHDGASHDGASHEDLAAEFAELEALYRVTPVAMCVVDRDLRYTRVNQEYADIVARRVDDVVGCRLEDVVHPRAREVTVGLVRHVIDTGRPVRNVELPGVSRTDPPRPLVWLVNVHPVVRDGEVTAAIGVLQNVTVTKELEQTARERLEELESVYRNLPVGLAMIDTELCYVRVNEVLAEINGRSVEEHIGRFIWDVVPELDRRFEAQLRAILEEKVRARGFEFRAVTPGGGGVERDLLARYELVRSRDGTISGVVASVLDVTGRVRAEEEARAARDRAEAQLQELEALYENTPAGMCLLDRDLRVLRINESLARATGFPLEENVGRTMYELAPGLVEQMQDALRLAFEIARPGVGLEVSGPLPSKPEMVRTWLVNVHPVRTKRGPVEAVIAVVQDVTPLKRQQAELAEVKARLEEAQRMARVGSWDWNIVDDVMWWSDELYELTGQRRGEFDPSWHSFFELVHPEDRPEMRRQLDATLEHDASYWVEFRVVMGDFEERVLRCAARLERSGDGLPKRLFGTCQDVTGQGPLRVVERYDREST